MNENINVNDGNGLYDNEGMCDSLVSDLNNTVKLIATGQYVLFCGKVYEMTVKLTNLKKGIREELESKNKIIEELKRVNNSLVEEKTGLPVDKDGVDFGKN